MTDDFKLEVAAHYTGPSLEVTVDRDPTINSTGDGIPWRSLYTVLVCKNNIQTSLDLANFKKCMAVREINGPGLYLRNPKDTTANGIDAIVYASVASLFIEADRAVARAILNELRLMRWHWDTQSPSMPDLESWMGRYLWLPGLLRICTGEPQNFCERTALATSLMFIPDKANCSQILMQWMIATATARSGGICASAANRAISHLESLYSTGMAGVCAAMFNKPNLPAHPFSSAEVWSY